VDKKKGEHYKVKKFLQEKAVEATKHYKVVKHFEDTISIFIDL
jgi:hypothetical protein